MRILEGLTLVHHSAMSMLTLNSDKNIEGPPSLQVNAHVATLSLNRPAHHNRLEPQDLALLEQLFAQIRIDDNIRVVMLRATGPSFCAGFDLRALASGDALSDPQQIERVINQLEALPQPTLCALNGAVHGGGIDLALACDFRIGIEGMHAHMPAAKLGVHYYAHGMRRYVRRLGANAARRLLLLGEPFDTAELLRCGFLDEAVPSDHFAAHIEALCSQLAQLPTTIVQGMKADLRAIENNQFDEHAINQRWQASLKKLTKTQLS
jgi:enoyl-CoA hydratase